MSSCSGNRGKKIKKQSNIELGAIIKFIKFIQALAGGMLGIAILGFLLVEKTVEMKVVYTMVIVTNLILVIGGIIPIKLLEKRDVKPE